MGLQPRQFSGSAWQVYPNPARNHLRILYVGSSPIEAALEIYRLNGQRMMSSVQVISPGVNSLVLPPEISRGMYILQIRSGMQVETIKLMVE